MFIDKSMKGYFTEVKNLFMDLEARCEKIKLTLSDYQDIEQHVYADRVFNSHQRDLFKKLHRYYLLIENAPKLDMQLHLSKKGKIKSIRLKLQNNAAKLISICFSSGASPDEMVLINKVIPNSGEGVFEHRESVLIHLKKHREVNDLITFNIEKNGFPYEMSYQFPGSHSCPDLYFFSYDDLFEKRNNLLSLLNLEEIENPFGDFSVLDDRRYDFVET